MRAGVEPADELAHRDEPAASLADDAQLVHHVLLEEVDADAQGVSRLLLRQGKAAERSSRRTRLLVLDRLPRSGHAPLSHEPARTPVWEWRGNGDTRFRRS